jgi:hypothetical protein
MWAALELDPELTPAALARHARGSFATAWQVKHVDRDLRTHHFSRLWCTIPTCV